MLRDKGGNKSETISPDVVNGKPKDRLGSGVVESRSLVKGGEAKREVERGKKPSQPDEAWAEWERDEMEKLLNEVRGQLGELLYLSEMLGITWRSDLSYKIFGSRRPCQ